MTLDPSAHMGWCHGVHGGPLKSGVYDVQGDRLTRKLLNIENFIINLIRANHIEKVYCETPIVANQNSFDSIRSSIGMNTAIGMACLKLGVSCFDLDQQTWRAGFMIGANGKGITKAPKLRPEDAMALLIDVKSNSAVAKFHETSTEKRDKARMTEARRRWMKKRTIAECVKRGHTVTDDNEADALGMWLFIQDRDAKKRATPELDLLGGLSI